MGRKASNCVSCITRSHVLMVLLSLLLSTTTLSQLHLNLYLNGFHAKFIHLKTNLLWLWVHHTMTKEHHVPQVHLRKILDAPGVNAYTLQEMSSFLVKAKKLDNNGNITNEGTVKFLETCFNNFVKYVGVVSKLKKPKPIEPEDLDCGNQLLQPLQKLILTIQNG